MIIRSEYTIGPTAYILKGIIEASIKWADRLYEKNVTMVNLQSLILNWKIEK